MLKFKIKKKRNSKMFNKQRYPEFKYKKTGKHSYVFEGYIENNQLRETIAKCRRDRFSYQYYDEKYERSGNYREEFFKNNQQDVYRCVYCHKKLTKNEITIDHLLPIQKAKTSKAYQYLLKRCHATTVNDIINLAPACDRCNSKKAAKGGLWLLRGYLGQYRAYWVVKDIAYALAIVLVLLLASQFIK